MSLRTDLIAGPYVPPAARAGDWLDDEIDGSVEVGGWSAGPIPWPTRKKAGRASLILCGDLLQAVRSESSIAVQHWFGVGPVTVYKWRKALGVGRMDSPGTVKLYQDLYPSKLPDQVAARGRKASKTPEALAKQAAAVRGRSAHPNTLAALHQARIAPKPAGWGSRANAWMQAAKE